MWNRPKRAKPMSRRCDCDCPFRSYNLHSLIFDGSTGGEPYVKFLVQILGLRAIVLTSCPITRKPSRRIRASKPHLLFLLALCIPPRGCMRTILPIDPRRRVRRYDSFNLHAKRETSRAIWLHFVHANGAISALKSERAHVIINDSELQIQILVLLISSADL